MDLHNLDPFSSQFLDDPHAHFKLLRDRSPVHHVASRNMWILSRYQHVMEAAKNYAVFSSTGGVGYDWNQRPMMPMYDPPQHSVVRRLVARPFSPASLASFRPRVDLLADELVRRALEAKSIDVVADLALPLSLGTIADLLGIPNDKRGRLRRWSQGTIAELAGGLVGAESRQVEELRREFNIFLRSLIEERREQHAVEHEAANDVISMLVAARDEDRMTSDQLVAFCVLLMVAGFETTVNAVSNALLALIAHPEQFNKLRADPALVPSMVEEVLRYDGPVLTFFRNTLSPITLEGVTIPKGEKVMLAFASANRDERKFKDPDVLRIDRDASNHLGFGAGVHFCIGAPLARIQLESIASALLRNTSKIDQDGPAQRTASVLFRGVKEFPVQIHAAANAPPITRTTVADWVDAAPAPPASIEPQPFQIRIADAELSDLRGRLERVRWPDQIEHAGWDYGTNLPYMQELISYWLERYDWRACERSLNELPHFTADVDTLKVHFIHARTNAKKKTPLLLLHGWPGPFTELIRLLPRLTRDDAGEGFDVVLGSLPGFPFSSRPRERGMGTMRMADTFAKLMNGLGYSRYGVVGVDFGAGIASRLGLVHADKILGIHLSMPYEDPPADQMSSLTKEENAWLQRRRQRDRDVPHAATHTRDPQTLAYGLNDSPVALAAWLIECYRAWSDCEGEVETRFSKDDLLTNIMLYWCTATGGSSTRIYFESRQLRGALGSGERIETPTAIAVCKKELVKAPRAWIERVYNLKRLTNVPAGGHFGAWEEPDAIAADVREFFSGLNQTNVQ